MHSLGSLGVSDLIGDYLGRVDDVLLTTSSQLGITRVLLHTGWTIGTTRIDHPLATCTATRADNDDSETSI